MVSFALVAGSEDLLSYEDTTTIQMTTSGCSNVRDNGVASQEQNLGIGEIA